MPGLTSTVVQTILPAATSDSAATRNSKLETALRKELDLAATIVQTA
jgi:hypothetical protein